MDKTEIKNLLEKSGLAPNKLMGQNFLADQNILAKIIEAANLTAGDAVLEVGPGLGILTEALAQKARKVIAIEKDPELFELLQTKFAGQKNIELILGDALKTDLDLGDYKLVANIPYYLTSHLIRIFLENPKPPKEMVLMIQKEVAERICAAPPKMSLLAVSVQFYAQPEILFKVSKNSFWPAPKVDSAVIRIKPKNKPENVDPERFFQVVKAGFAQPRKQLAGNLSRGLNLEAEKTKTIMAQAGIKPEQRAETLQVQDWIALTRLIFPEK